MDFLLIQIITTTNNYKTTRPITMNTRSANQVQRLLLINNLIGVEGRTASKPLPEDLIPTLLEFTGITAQDARKRRNKFAAKTPARCLQEYTFARYKIPRGDRTVENGLVISKHSNLYRPEDSYIQFDIVCCEYCGNFQELRFDPYRCNRVKCGCGGIRDHGSPDDHRYFGY